MNYSEFRFAFFATDFERSVRFYQEVHGLTYTSGWDRPDGKGALLPLRVSRSTTIGATARLCCAIPTEFRCTSTRSCKFYCYAKLQCNFA
jgi:hypothetical protein